MRHPSELRNVDLGNGRIRTETERPTIVHTPPHQSPSYPSSRIPRVASNFAVAAHFDNLPSRYAPEPIMNKGR